MRTASSGGRRPYWWGLAVAGLAALFVVCGLLLPAFALPAAGAAVETGGGQKVVLFEDVTIPPGEVRENVVVVGGDVTVQGTVLDLIVIVGGDVVVASGGVVGDRMHQTIGDTVLVSVLGDVTVEPGGTVMGRSVDVAGDGSGIVDAMVVDPLIRPWDDWSSVGGWIGSTVFIMLVAVIATVIAPRQIAFTSDRARRHPFSSLGWGALGLIVIVPLVSVVLVITLIGILALVPWWLAAIVALLFGYTAVGAMIGRFVMGRSDRRGRVMLAAVIGVLVLSVVQWIPIAGGIITFLALILGLGATFTALWEWRRRPHVKPGQAPGTPGMPAGMPPGTPPQPHSTGSPYAGPYGTGYQSSPGAADTDRRSDT